MVWVSRNSPSFPSAPEKVAEAQPEPQMLHLSHHAHSFFEHR